MAYPQKTFVKSIVDNNSLVGRRRQTACAHTLLYQLDVLKTTGRYDAFRLKWHPTYDELPMVWPIPNHLFWDSDVAKWIEGACYFLQLQSLPQVHSAVAELVEMIANAQQPDGYLNIHYTVVEPGKRFTNLRDMHELYNAGHLIEAALAHNELYQNNLLLQPILRYVDLLCTTFGPHDGQIHGYPGHPEIELALLRLYEHTKTPKHLELARYFITERGNPSGMAGQHYFDWEAQKRGDDPSQRPAFYPEPRCLWYHQAHAPIETQETILGHSVRAMYLLTAVADLIRIDQGSNATHLKQALYRLWDNMTQRKMYITGGIGAVKQWEGFGDDFFLPQGTDDGGCYAETCAAIGVMMLAQRMLQIELDSRFADIMELCLYNAVLTSMSHDGKAFTYANQLASSDQDPAKREEWFTVACCPPNILRLLGQIGGYVWTHLVDEKTQTTTVIANLYVPSTTEIVTGAGKTIKISQEGDWPWKSSIPFRVESSDRSLQIKLRIPRWAPSFQVEPACPTYMLKDGYLTLPEAWVAENPNFSLTIPLQPRWLAPHPFTGQATLALARGPVIYCVEDHDNAWDEDHFRSTFVDPDCKLTERDTADTLTGDRFVSIDLIGGAKRLDISKVNLAPSMEAHQVDSLLAKGDVIPKLQFIPYYFRANRGGKGHMRVGLRRLCNKL